MVGWKADFNLPQERRNGLEENETGKQNGLGTLEEDLRRWETEWGRASSHTISSVCSEFERAFSYPALLENVLVRAFGKAMMPEVRRFCRETQIPETKWPNEEALKDYTADFIDTVVHKILKFWINDIINRISNGGKLLRLLIHYRGDKCQP